MDVNKSNILGISVVVLAVLLLTCVEQVTSEAGQPGEACLSTGLCLNNDNMTCEHETCKIKKGKSCVGFEDHCVKNKGCVVTCPCCKDQGFVCGKSPSKLLKSCVVTVVVAVASWVGAILITGGCFYLVLEVCGR